MYRSPRVRGEIRLSDYARQECAPPSGGVGRNEGSSGTRSPRGDSASVVESRRNEYVRRVTKVLVPPDFAANTGLVRLRNSSRATARGGENPAGAGSNDAGHRSAVVGGP